MKAIIILMLSFYQLQSFAQTDDKPIWSQNLPKRQDAPDLEIDNEIDTDLDLEFDRGALFDDESNEEVIVEDRPFEDNLDSSAEESVRLEKEVQQEAERIAELDRLAEEKRQAGILAEEARATEQQKQAELRRNIEEKRLLEKAQVEDKRLADEKKIAELEADEAVDNNIENITSPENQEDDEQSQPADLIYKWKKIKNVLPEYPSKAARTKKEGWVEVEVVIANNGGVVGAHPVKTYKNEKVFIQAALRAVRKWKFDPPVNYGIRSNQTKIVRIVFKL